MAFLGFEEDFLTGCGDRGMGHPQIAAGGAGGHTGLQGKGDHGGEGEEWGFYSTLPVGFCSLLLLRDPTAPTAPYRIL